MRKILVVGGGSAGWIAASYLNSVLNHYGKLNRVHVTLIESPDIPRISVGEATIPSMRHVLNAIGVDELEFMKTTNATFKQSIRYQNWVKNDGGYYHHPYSRFSTGAVDRAGQDWLASNRSMPFMSTVTPQTEICDRNQSPRVASLAQRDYPLVYAYHMNAQLFADYLRDFSTARGVTHVLDNVTSIEMRENGLIRAIKTQGGKEIEADVFVDSTGFRSALLGTKLGVPYEDCSQFLLCDHALTTHIPYDKFFPGHVRPYTTATALSSGWIWDIPMNDRRSIGYVHSSAFISPDEAEAELRRYEGAHSEGLDTRRVKFHVGRRQHWKGNCIGIGLAAGFIEPLESTGLYLADMASVMLAEHFPWKDDMFEAMAFRYNRIMSNRFYEILDFINLHYCLTQRADTPFWREVQKPEHITDRLKAKFEFWKMKPPTPSDFADQFFPGMSQQAKGPGVTFDDRPAVDTGGLWNYQSYEFIMYGMQFCGQHLPPPDANAPKPVPLPAVSSMAEETRWALPQHHVWLQRMVGMKEYKDSGYQPAGWMQGQTFPI